MFQRTSLAVAAEEATARFGVSAALLSLFAVGQLRTSLMTIFVIGVALDLLAPSGQYDVRDLKIAFCFQYVVWVFGLLSLRRTRRLARLA